LQTYPRGFKCMLALLVVLLSIKVTAFANEEVVLAEQQLARDAMGAFAAELKQSLVSAMGDQGPVAAVAVCAIEAPQIAARLSSEYGVTVSRTSLRARNPGNAPLPEWQRSVLLGWQAAHEAGTLGPDAEYFQSTGRGGFRLMKPIRVQPMCLTCHGTNIEPQVLTAISERYPADEAVGYAAGDLRGAFVVVGNDRD